MTHKVPSKEIDSLARKKWFSTSPFSILAEQMATPQSPIYHPEGSVWNHTLLVLDEVASRRQYSTCPRTLMWAALLHDIGKPMTTKKRKGRITAYDHDKVGARLAHKLLMQVSDEPLLAEDVSWLVRYHMQPLYVLKGLPFQDISGMKAYTSVTEVAMLGYCDRLGRGGADKTAETNEIITFLEKCNERTDFVWLKQA